jgi:hypothetical protein
MINPHHWVLVALLWIPVSLLAAPAGQVEQVQTPAWLERAGTRQPVAPGMALDAGDVLRTGPNARLLVRLAEGSYVKLGAGGELRLQALKAPDTAGGTFEGLLDVLKGAFRFTTTALSQRYRRRLDVRVTNVTAGIRGTDVWGKAAPDRDIVCLIEGEVTVERGTDPVITMNQPLSFYVAPRGRPALPVTPVAPEQLQRWALETDMQENGPVLAADGPWIVYLESLSTREAAERSKDRIEERGFPIQVHEAVVAGSTRYRVGVSGFARLTGAREFRTGLARAAGFSGAWIGKR